MKPYTLIFICGKTGTVSTISVEAHCQKCAFAASLETLSKHDMNFVRCVGLFNGKLDNMWPELEETFVNDPDLAKIATATNLKAKHDTTIN